MNLIFVRIAFLFPIVAVYFATAIFALPVQVAPQASVGALLTRDALNAEAVDLALRFAPEESNDLYSRTWKTGIATWSQKLPSIPWKKKPKPVQKIEISKHTEVIQHYDSLPNDHVHVKLPGGHTHPAPPEGPRPMHPVGIAYSTDDPAYAVAQPVKKYRPLPQPPVNLHRSGAKVWHHKEE